MILIKIGLGLQLEIRFETKDPERREIRAAASPHLLKKPLLGNAGRAVKMSPCLVKVEDGVEYLGVRVDYVFSALRIIVFM